MSFRSITILLCAAVFAAPSFAQIAGGGIVNVASFAPNGLPNSDIARGSILTIFGSQLADDGVQTAQSFPLQTTMGGASVQVAVAGTTVDCFMIFTTPGQVAALLPSNTPSGSGTLMLTYSGATYSEPVRVVDSSPGVFTQNSQGSGPASFTNFISSTEQPLNQLDRSVAGRPWDGVDDRFGTGKRR